MTAGSVALSGRPQGEGRYLLPRESRHWPCRRAGLRTPRAWSRAFRHRLSPAGRTDRRALPARCLRRIASGGTGVTGRRYSSPSGQGGAYPPARTRARSYPPSHILRRSCYPFGASVNDRAHAAPGGHFAFLLLPITVPGPVQSANTSALIAMPVRLTPPVRTVGAVCSRPACRPGCRVTLPARLAVAIEVPMPAAWAPAQILNSGCRR